MWEEILSVTGIYFAAMLKFIAGPLGGYAAGLTLLTTILTTVASMMTVVLAFSFFGDYLRQKLFNRFFVNRKRFSDSNRKRIALWRKYGLPGVAALTPILLTPIGGTLLAISFSTPREKLIVYMFISASVWSVLISTVVYLLGDDIVSQFNIQWTP